MSQTRTGEVRPITQHSKPESSRISGMPDPVPAQKQSRIRRLRIPLVVVLVVALAFVMKLTLFAPRALAVNAIEVHYGLVEHTICNTRAGTVKARLRAGLSPQTSGRVVDLPLREGDTVRAGVLLMRVDASIQQARQAVAAEDVRVAEARADEACSAAELAVSDLGRFRDLESQGIASEQVVDGLEGKRDTSAATCRAATASLSQSHAMLRLAQAELALTTITAPFDGVVAEVNTEVGEWITPSPPGMQIPPIIDVLDPSSLYIAAPIDEMDADQVVAGQLVRITVDSHRDRSFGGRIVRVAPYVVDSFEQNRTVEVEAEFDDPSVGSFLLPGTSADIEVVIDRHEDVLQIPSSAIAQNQQVFIVSGGGLEERTITAGLSNWRTTEIVAGLDEGDLVVVSRDNEELSPGIDVEVSEVS